MAEYVDLNLLKERFKKRLQWLKLDVHDEYSGALLDGCETDFDLIDEIPVAKNVKEIVYAHWIEKKEHLYFANGICKEWMIFYCSKCDVPSPAPTQYCPHCGAEMSEVK